MIHPNKILIHENVLKKIRKDAKFWAKQGLESGGYLLGKVHLPNLIFEVTEFIDGGPKAMRTSTSFSGDREYATQKKMELQKLNPEIRLIGEYHLHPWKGFPYPSGWDLHQLNDVKNSERPWYIIMLANKDGFRFWDLDDEGKKFIEVPNQVLRLSKQVTIDQKELMNRILEIVKHDVLAKKCVTIIGLGSGGSVIAKYLGVTGIGRIILVDNDQLELANIIRHEGRISNIGMMKTRICKKIIESHNPFIVVETYDIDAFNEMKKIDDLASRSDLIIASTGNPKINNIINKICLDRNVPAVYGGVFEKATGGYVLAVIPNETSCFNCVFNMVSQSYHVDQEVARNYGLSLDEMHAQQGLWMDISIPALIMARIALMMLQGETEFLKDYNFVLYKNDFTIRKMKVERRMDCAVCNFEGWMEHMEKIIESSKASKLRKVINSLCNFLGL